MPHVISTRLKSNTRTALDQISTSPKYNDTYCIISDFENKLYLISSLQGPLLSFHVTYSFDLEVGVLRAWTHSLNSLEASRAVPQCTEKPPLPWP